MKYSITSIVIIAMLIGLFYLLSSPTELPPTDMANHIEESPPSHIVERQIPLQIFKHMLEHSDGTVVLV